MKEIQYALRLKGTNRLARYYIDTIDIGYYRGFERHYISFYDGNEKNTWLVDDYDTALNLLTGGWAEVSLNARYDTPMLGHDMDEEFGAGRVEIVRVKTIIEACDE